MAKDTWALLGVYAAGFLLLAGMILGVYDRLGARIEYLDARLSAEIRKVHAELTAKIEAVRVELGAEIREVKAGQGAIRERLVRLETMVGFADQGPAPIVADEDDRSS